MTARGLPLLLLALVLGLATAPPRAAAHDHPYEITVEVGKSVDFRVTDAGTCKALVRASVLSPSPLVSVSPDEGFGVSVKFTVTAFDQPGEETIAVEWIGVDALNGTDGPCQEVSGLVPILVHVVAPPRDGSAGSKPASGKAGDPVNTFTGELTLDEPPDLDMGGPLPLRFSRTYASKLRINFVVGDLGDNWRHGFEWRVHSSGTLATMVNAQGKVLKYLQEGEDWTLQGTTDSPIRLARDGTGWVCIDPADDLVRRFDGSGRMTSVEDGRGNRLLLEYSVSTGKLDRVVEDAPASTARALHFAYDDGLLATVTERWGGVPGRSVSFGHEGEELVSFTDAAGGITVYAYDGEHADPALLTTRTSPRGNVPFTQEWDEVGKVAVQRDADGNEWSFDYGPPQKPGTTKVTRPDGKVETHVHDAAGALASASDGAGNAVAIADDDGAPRRAAIEDGAGARTLRSFDAASGLVTSTTDALGNETTLTWAERTSPVAGAPRRDLVRIDHPDGTFETFGYDGSGNRTSRTDGEGNSWTSTFDGRGNRLTETDPLGRTTSWTWDGWGNPASTTDPAGKVTTFQYDAWRRLSGMLLPDGTSRAFTRDLLDRPLTETDGEGRTRTRTWDANGNMTSGTDFAGVTTTFAYDDMDRVISAEDGAGGVSSTAYDDLGRISSLTDRLGRTSTRGYDAADRQVSEEDPLGGEWGSGYDGAGRVIASTFPSGRVLRLDRDPAGRVVRVETPSGRRRWTGFDRRGRVVRTVDGAGRVTRLTLDGRGLPEEIDVGGGAAVASHGWSDAGSLLSVTDGGGAAWTFGREARDLASSRTDPLGRTTTITFDGVGRPVRHDFPGSLGHLDLLLDDAGEVVRRTFSDGTVLDFARDGEGRWLSATGAAFTLDARGAIASSNGMAVGRDAEGRITSVALAPGKTVTYQYDARGRLIRVQDWAGGRADLARDEDGRLTGITRTNGVATDFTLDPDGNITGIREGALAETTLVRDGAGTVIAATREGPLVPGLGEGDDGDLVLDAAHQAAGSEYDALGRTTADGTRSYTWDLASRLVSIEEGPTNVDATFDAFGLLLSREDGGPVEEWTWNHAYGIPAPCVRRVGGGDPEFFVHAPDGTLLWSVLPSGARRWYHFDEAGNTILLTDDAGAVTDAYAHDPWGVLQSSTGATDNPFTFGGRFGVMKEGEGGLFRMRVRVYDAAARRFLSREPMTERVGPLDLAPYAYAAGDPLGLVDPTGEAPGDPAPSLSATDIAAKVNAGVGVYAEAEERLYNATRVLQRTGAQEAFKNKVVRAGGAANYVGTGIEIYNANNRMTDAIDRFTARSRDVWDWFRRMLNEANDLYRQKRMTLDQLRAFRRALVDAREAQLQANRDGLWTDTLQTSTIMALNSFTGLIPGAGLVPALDWSNANGIGGALGVVEK